MPRTATAVHRSVTIDGAALEPDLEAQLESILVVDRLAMPDTFQLTFRDPRRSVLSKAHITVGSAVVVSSDSLVDPEVKTLLDGEVTSIEVAYDRLGTRTIVRGYDRSHRLSAGTKTKVFVNVTASDIVKQIAGDAGFQTDVDDSDVTFEHLVQANVSDLDFLYELASRSGHDLRVDGETLLFKKPTDSANGPDVATTAEDDPTKLMWGAGLQEFRARLSAVAQVEKVEVRGWDPSAKEAITGEAMVNNKSANPTNESGELISMASGKALHVVDRPLTTKAEADRLAQARADQVGSASYEGGALVPGDPDLHSGVTVSVGGVDSMLEGKWVVSCARHEFEGGQYRTSLEFTGRQDRSVSGSISRGATRERIPGVVIGIVTQNQDATEMGRLQVKFPWLDSEAESPYARLAAPGAGPDSGVLWVPEVGDEVLVAFDHGDVMFPVILGGLWNGSDAIPFEDADLDEGKVTRRSLTSRQGHRIDFYDADDKLGIEFATKDDKIVIHLDHSNGELTMTVDGALKVETTGDIELKAKGNFKVDAQQSVEIKASGQTSIKGATIALG